MLVKYSISGDVRKSSAQLPEAHACVPPALTIQHVKVRTALHALDRHQGVDAQLGSKAPPVQAQQRTGHAQEVAADSCFGRPNGRSGWAAEWALEGLSARQASRLQGGMHGRLHARHMVHELGVLEVSPSTVAVAEPRSSLRLLGSLPPHVTNCTGSVGIEEVPEGMHSYAKAAHQKGPVGDLAPLYGNRKLGISTHWVLHQLADAPLNCQRTGWRAQHDAGGEHGGPQDRRKGGRKMQTRAERSDGGMQSSASQAP